ncbi:amino acid adenylation domain-containing protein [Micromonospora sp. DT229]|uniref:amino acid adenylation domain-containing protein n=1 Tax=Micromonospora sp. DT229 TaxID=3393430 RepID=UPI003CF2F0DD
MEPDVTLAELFRSQAERTPDAVAVVDDNTSLTFAELDRAAQNLAASLTRAGVGPERIVAVRLHRSPALVVALIAIAKAGGAYLALDPQYPAERTEFMLADAKPTVLLDHEGLHRLRDLAPPRSRQRPEHPAYVVYTSGSTGTPKGVVMPGSSLVNLCAWHATQLPSGPGVRVAQLSALGFDVSLHELWSSLVLGKTLCVPSEETRRDPVLLVRWLTDHAIHQMYAPTVLLEAVFAAALALGEGLTELRDVLQSGEALRLGATVRRFLGWRPQVRLRNQYGSAEMQDVAAAVVPNAVPPELTAAPIGTALRRTTLHVLDETMREVPAGAVGELYVTGAGLARGYLDRPALTAERFLPAVDGPPGARMYRTGDLVRRGRSGELFHVGRADDQVKIRGFRVEPAEVEAALTALPAVAQAAVIARPHASGQLRLVGYVVPAADADPTPDSIVSALTGRLPAHLVPATVLLLDRLPVTPSGKIDRAALPEPPTAAPDPVGRPDNERERFFCDLFGQLLGLPGPAGADQHLFALGGDSMTALTLVTRAREAGVVVGTADVFTSGTPRGLAAAARPDPRAVTVAPSVWLDETRLARIQRAMPGVEDVLPLTPLQRGLLFHAVQSGSGDPYREHVTVQLTGRLHIGRLRTAVRTLVRRQPALRAGFLADAEPLQLIAPTTGEVWETPFPTDPAEPPLLRLALDELGPDLHRLTITFHHLILDGASAGHLVRQLFAAYDGADGDPAPYAQLVRGLATRDTDGAEQVWRMALDGISPAEEPTLDLAREPRTLRGGVGTTQTPRIEALARAHGLTLSTLVLAAWGRVLSDRTGRTDVVFDTTVSDRPQDRPGAPETLGLFVNTVPVRVRCAREEPLLATARRVHDEQAALMSYRHLGLGDIQRAAGWAGSPDTILVFENRALQVTEFACADGLRVHDIEFSDRTHYPVSVLATPGDALRLQVTYRPEVVAEQEAADLLGRLVEVLGTAHDDDRTG